MKSLRIKNFLLLAILLFGLGMLTTSCLKDPCADITCKNGGECIDGECDCPPEYTGEFCGEENTPSSMTIEKVVLKGYPSGNYDLSSRADPYVYITDRDGNEIVTSVYYSDTYSNNEYTYDSQFPLTLSSPSKRYNIYLYDYDPATNDDIIGSKAYYWYPYNKGDGFPETETIYSSDVGVEYTLYYSYSY